MKILILSFYYYPDLCAGSFRCTQLINQFKKLIADTSALIEIDVITTFPNRYSSFSPDAPGYERQGNVSIRRIKLPEHQGGMVTQGKSFIHYSREALKHTRSQKYDLVFGTSSRLMTAVLATFIAKKHAAKIYLDIRDIFVDTIGDVFPKKISFFLKPFFSFLEKWSFKKANHINLVSEGFSTYFKTRYPHVPLSYFTNGIDPEFIQVEPKIQVLAEDNRAGAPITILYAGNTGEGQGLHRIIPEFAQKIGPNYLLKIIGEGGRITQLREATRNLTNVVLLPPISREALIREYQEADILFLHLNAHKAFLKVLPSKIFEYGATGKPILAGVSGYAAQFIQNELENAAVFKPCDSDGAKEALAGLRLETRERDGFIHKFSRESIMKTMVEDILNTVVIPKSSAP